MLGVIQNLLEARLVEWLQQVSEGVHVERLDRVLVKRGDEHDPGQRRRELLHHFEPVEIGHLHVEQKQVRMRALNSCHRFPPIHRFANHLNLGIGSKEAQQLAARGRFVVHHKDAQSGHAVAACSGMRTDTVNPPSGPLSKLSWWCSP